MFVGDKYDKKQQELIEKLTVTERKQFACEFDCKEIKAWWYKHKCYRLRKKLDKLYMRERNDRKKAKGNKR